MKLLASRYEMEMMRSRTASGYGFGADSRANGVAVRSASPRLDCQRASKTDQEESHKSLCSKSEKSKSSRCRGRSKNHSSTKKDLGQKQGIKVPGTKARKLCAVRNSITPEEEKVNFSLNIQDHPHANQEMLKNGGRRRNQEAEQVFTF